MADVKHDPYNVVCRRHDPGASDFELYASPSVSMAVQQWWAAAFVGADKNQTHALSLLQAYLHGAGMASEWNLSPELFWLHGIAAILRIDSILEKDNGND